MQINETQKSDLVRPERAVAPMRQLLLSLELAGECVRLADRYPETVAEVVPLCLDHIAHAEALGRLLVEQLGHIGRAGHTGDVVGRPEAVSALSDLLRVARDTAVRACMAATAEGEVEMFGAISAALASHEAVLEAE
jgi:hypothetical protein